MRSSRSLGVVMTVCALAASGQRGALAEGVERVPLPPGVTREEVVRAGGSLRAVLSRHVDRWMTARAGADRDVGDVVVLVDGAGRPIRPDLVAVASGVAPIAAADSALTFTFDSPDDPWTGDEISRMQSILRLCQRRALVVYGPPFLPNVVNVRRAALPGIAGTYNPFSNEITVPDVNADALCHEMIHAFRDDAFLLLRSYEEGMTRAAEIEVFNRMTVFPHSFDERHGYVYDVFYEAMNSPVIGSGVGGGFFNGYVSPFLRYQLAGYAWWKVFLENSSFFADFNQAVYAVFAADPTMDISETTLKAIAAQVQGEVEASPFADWYARQGVLETAPPQGYFLYPRVTSANLGALAFTLDFFARLSTGQEIMQAGAPVDWAVYDHAETLRASGSALTSPNGFVTINLALPPDYRGRIRILATATAPGGSAAVDVFEYWGEPIGVFGIVTSADSGTVRIRPAGRGYTRTAPVVNGAFVIPGLRRRKGAYDATFSGTNGETIARRFNKDRSDYFLRLTPTS